MSRAAELARNVRFTASFAVGVLLADPAWLVLQASRRLPARLNAVVVPWVEKVVGDGTSGTAGRLRAAWTAGDVAGIREWTPRRRTERRVRQALLVHIDGLAVQGPPGGDAPDGTSPAGTAPAKPAGPVARPADRLLAVHHHLTNSLPHTQSGYTLRTQAILASQREAGHRVTATTRAGYPLTIGSLTARGTDVVDGVPYTRLIPRSLPPTYTERARDEFDLLIEAVAHARPDVVHATTPWTTGKAARRVAQHLGLPWVYEVRGLPEETWAASHPTAAREAATASQRFAMMRAAETDLARTADHVVTLSATMRDELTARGVAAERITVVPNAVDATLLDAGTPTPAQARERLGLTGPRYLVGTVSSVVGYEGIDTILRTVARLRDDGVDAGALVVGDGVARPGLLRLAAELGIAEQTVMPGRVAREVARTYLAALDVVLVPRRPDRVTRLVTPLKPVEAMALGRPVVASDLPALREVCSSLDGGEPAGVLVPPDDDAAWTSAVGQVLSDGASHAALVAAGRAVAGERTWKRLVPRYEAAYAAACAVTTTGREARR